MSWVLHSPHLGCEPPESAMRNYGDGEVLKSLLCDCISHQDVTRRHPGEEGHLPLDPWLASPYL